MTKLQPNQRLQRVSRLDEQRHDHTHSADESDAPRVRHHLAVIVDVDPRVKRAHTQVGASQRVEGRGVEARRIARDDGSGEEAEVLEAVLLSGFGATYAGFGLWKALVRVVGCVVD